MKKKAEHYRTEFIVDYLPYEIKNEQTVTGI